MAQAGPYSKARFAEEKKPSYTARSRVAVESRADYGEVASVGDKVPSHTDRRKRIMYPSKTPFSCAASTSTFDDMFRRPSLGPDSEQPR